VPYSTQPITAGRAEKSAGFVVQSAARGIFTHTWKKTRFLRQMTWFLGFFRGLAPATDLIGMELRALELYRCMLFSCGPV
jgi:hypothetical protein